MDQVKICENCCEEPVLGVLDVCKECNFDELCGLCGYGEVDYNYKCTCNISIDPGKEFTLDSKVEDLLRQQKKAMEMVLEVMEHIDLYIKSGKIEQINAIYVTGKLLQTIKTIKQQVDITFDTDYMRLLDSKHCTEDNELSK